ncbi:hypothetical protein MAR_014506, partial [Mya arenaria]
MEDFSTENDENLEEYIKNIFKVDFYCPDLTMVKMVHARAMERFRYQFEDMTNATMCSYMKQNMGKDIMQYIVNNYYGYYRKRGIEQDFENVNMDMTAFDEICGRVRMMVDGMLVNFMDIEKLFDGSTPREEVRQKFEPVVG